MTSQRGGRRPPSAGSYKLPKRFRLALCNDRQYLQMVDGVDIREINIRHLRSHIASKFAYSTLQKRTFLDDSTIKARAHETHALVGARGAALESIQPIE